MKELMDMLLLNYTLGKIEKTKDTDLLKKLSKKTIVSHIDSNIREIYCCMRGGYEEEDIDKYFDKISGVLAGLYDFYKAQGLDEKKIQRLAKDQYVDIIDEIRDYVYFNELENYMKNYEDSKNYLAQKEVLEAESLEKINKKINEELHDMIKTELSKEIYSILKFKCPSSGFSLDSSGKLKAPEKLESLFNKHKKNILKSEKHKKNFRRVDLDKDRISAIWEDIIKKANIKKSSEPEGDGSFIERLINLDDGEYSLDDGEYYDGEYYEYQEPNNSWYIRHNNSFEYESKVRLTKQIKDHVNQSLEKLDALNKAKLEALNKVSFREAKEYYNSNMPGSDLEGKILCLQQKANRLRYIQDHSYGKVLIKLALGRLRQEERQKYILGSDGEKLAFITKSSAKYHVDMLLDGMGTNSLLGGGYVTFGLKGKPPQEKLNSITLSRGSYDFGKEPREITVGLLKKAFPYCDVKEEE